MTRYSFSHCCCHLGAPLGHLCNFVAICCFFRSDTKGTWSRTFVYFLEFLDVIIFCSIILIVCLLLFSIIFTILYCLFLKVESILENTQIPSSTSCCNCSKLQTAFSTLYITVLLNHATLQAQNACYSHTVDIL